MSECYFITQYLDNSLCRVEGCVFGIFPFQSDRSIRGTNMSRMKSVGIKKLKYEMGGMERLKYEEGGNKEGGV